jgi:hypothetical protein
MNCLRVLDELGAELLKADGFKVFSDDPDGDLVLSLGPRLDPDDPAACIGH